MPIARVFAAALLLCATTLTAQEPSQAAPEINTALRVYLDGPADLELLRQTNLKHYLRAQKILAEARKMCRVGAPQTFRTHFDGTAHCDDSTWKTSFPPKKQLSFTLDDIEYIALVTVSGPQGQITEAGDRAR